VTAYGTAGNGPAYFIVKDRNGRTYQYGNGGNSQVLANGTSTALSWLLNQVTDPAGNSMTIAYTPAIGTAVPSTISWTPTSHGGSSYQYTMTFNYLAANVAASSYYGYVAGTSVQNTNLLAAINIASAGTTIRKYALRYQLADTSGHNKLYQVQECADSGATNCLLPTTMTYQAGSKGLGAPSTLTSSAVATSKIYGAYDFNGDGRNDLTWYGTSGTWWVAFGTPTGYSAPINTGLAGYYPHIVIDKVDGTGLDEFFVSLNSVWYYYKWNGSSFSAISTGIATNGNMDGTYTLADVNVPRRAHC